MIALDSAFIVAGAGLLWFGAGWIVDSAAAVARRFGISELVIGLTIVAMGTSAPEFLVTLTAAFKGLNDISLANVVGSNIFNLGIVLGLMAVISPIPTHPTLLRRDGLILWIITGLALFMALDLYLSRWDGAILFASFLAYISFIGYRALKRPEEAETLLDPDAAVERDANWKDGPKLLAGFAAIAGGSQLLVEGASSLALVMGISEWAVGLTIVASGTSLPELVTCLAASMRGKNDMLLGNLIGSDFFNFAGVLGLTCLLNPLTVSSASLPGMYVLVGAVFFVLVFIRTGWRLTRGEGFVLIGINIGRWIMEFAV